MVTVSRNTLASKNLNWFSFCSLYLAIEILTFNLLVMIKVLKLQKALISIILGVIALVAYIIMSQNKMKESNYMLEASGLLLMLGGLLFLYPILFSRKDDKGCIELDPEVPITESTEPER